MTLFSRRASVCAGVGGAKTSWADVEAVAL
jgi:hypothetical protein